MKQIDIDRMPALFGCFNPPMKSTAELLDWIIAAQKENKRLTAALKTSQEKVEGLEEQYINRSPTEWAYKQACSAIEKQRTRAEQAEARVARLVKVNINYVETLDVIASAKTCEECNAQDYAQHAIDHAKQILADSEEN